MLVSGSRTPGGVTLDVTTLRVWRASLAAMREARLPDAPNVPKSHPLMFLLVTSDDGLENTKKWNVTEDLAALLERLFPGDLDDQRHHLLDLMRRTALYLQDRQQDVVFPSAPSAMEMLEAECIARLPELPVDEAETLRWQRLRIMRREWLYGRVDLWTGALRDIDAPKTHGKIQKARSTARSLRLGRAGEIVELWWIAALEAALSEA